MSFKEAAAQIMEKAYNKVSGNGLYPANARQIMYAARPHIQEETGKQLDDNYFTQTLLPDYLQENDVAWDVVYDARGHFAEPHTRHSFGIGTLKVRNYLAGFHDPTLIDAAFTQAKVETSGPSGSFGAVLFLEKEGFDQILEAAQIADRYDVAIMSTKGMSVVAARALADQMCSDHDIPLLLLHDFDKAGFSIAGTLQRDTRRYEFQNSITTIDLGLGLDDVKEMGLESEYQHHPKGSKHAMMDNLRENGASAEEIAFMFQDFDRLRSTRRVELNAMTSPQFVAFVERKLKENNVEKIVPDKKVMDSTYLGFKRGLLHSQAIAKLGAVDMADAKAPDHLENLVRAHLTNSPATRWDAAIAKIVGIDMGANPSGEQKSGPEGPGRRRPECPARGGITFEARN